MTVITVDGPSGAGKGTVVMALANELGYSFLDSGALYRLVALQALTQNCAFEDEKKLEQIALELPVSFAPGEPESGARVFLDNKEVSLVIRTEEVAAMASKIAAIPCVRTALLQRQRDFDQGKGLVADGRDMGTVVFPKAEFKFFLTANAEKRGKRRLTQLLAKGDDAKIEDIIRSIQERDERDKNRAVSPLVPAHDAFVIDTSDLSAAEVVNSVRKKISNK